MKSNIKKLIGWLLLIAGLIIIAWALYSSYNIFSAKDEAPEIFSSSARLEDGDKVEEEIPDIEEQMKQMMEEHLESLFPKSFGPRFLNLITWSIFAGILVFGGGKISIIGIKLIGNK